MRARLYVRHVGISTIITRKRIIYICESKSACGIAFLQVNECACHFSWKSLFASKRPAIKGGSCITLAATFKNGGTLLYRQNIKGNIGGKRCHGHAFALQPISIALFGHVQKSSSCPAAILKRQSTPALPSGAYIIVIEISFYPRAKLSILPEARNAVMA